ncbi:MAG TPA: hypothetical protein PLD46_03250 [Hyphomicrobium sp.]|nr:hypothetical protein [Hyphomicrobium sp.]
MSTSIANLPPELRKRLSAELSPGERLFYVAQPDWRGERGTMILLFCVGVFWSMIALTFFGVSVTSLAGYAPVTDSSAPPSLPLMWFFFFFSLPFVAIGFGLLASPFLGIRKSKNTAHAITDARLINVYGGADAGVETYKLDAINFIRRRDRKNGSGNLSIGYGVGKDSDGDPRPLTTDWSGIPDVQRAEAIIRGLAHWVR